MGFMTGKKTGTKGKQQPGQSKIKCPCCKVTDPKKFLFNQASGMFACSYCGTVFMDASLVKTLLDKINNPNVIIMPNQKVVQ